MGEDERQIRGGSQRAWHVVGLVGVAIGFAITLERASVSWHGGDVSVHYRNWGALAGGALAVAAALIALVGLRRSAPAARSMNLLASLGLLAVGGVHIARGLGAFYDPGARPGFDHETIGDVHLPPPRTEAVEIDAATAPDAGPSPADLAEQAAVALRGACPDDQSPPCQKWRAAVEHACDAGAMAQCGNLGAALLDNPIGGPADPARGRALARKACDAGDSGGCLNLGYAEHLGLGGAKDLVQARVHEAKACEQEDRVGCSNLTTYLANDPDVTSDDALAGHTSACMQGAILKACERGSDILLARKGRSADESKHLRLVLAQACRLENGTACGLYATMLRTGEGGPAHAALADAVALRGCNIGHAELCPRGRKPPHGAVVVIDHVSALDPEEYEEIPLLDDLESKLAPCAALPGTDKATFVAKVAVAHDGALTLTRKDASTTAADVDRCIAEHTPTKAPPLGVPTGDVTDVWFNVQLTFGTLGT